MNSNEKKDCAGDLIARVRRGDNAAFEELLKQYTPLIEAAVARTLGDGEYSLYAEDLRQEAALVFYNSILTYDTEQSEVEFGLYAKICISNALVSQFRSLKKIRSDNMALTEDGELPDGAEYDEPSVRFIEQESLTALYSAIGENLTSLEYRVWRLYMSGRTAKQIGAVIGKDEKSVTNAVYRIRKKLRALLGNNNE